MYGFPPFLLCGRGPSSLTSLNSSLLEEKWAQSNSIYDPSLSLLEEVAMAAHSRACRLTAFFAKVVTATFDTMVRIAPRRFFRFFFLFSFFTFSAPWWLYFVPCRYLWAYFITQQLARLRLSSIWISFLLSFFLSSSTLRLIEFLVGLQPKNNVRRVACAALNCVAPAKTEITQPILLLFSKSQSLMIGFGNEFRIERL